MKKPVKKYLQQPSEMDHRVFYAYIVDGAMACIEWQEDVNFGDFRTRFRLSDITKCVEQIAATCNTSPDNVIIAPIILEGDDNTTLEFSLIMKKSKEAYKKEMDEFKKYEQDYARDLAAWEEYNKNQKIENLKKELQKLESAK